MFRLVNLRRRNNPAHQALALEAAKMSLTQCVPWDYALKTVCAAKGARFSDIPKPERLDFSVPADFAARAIAQHTGLPFTSDMELVELQVAERVDPATKETSFWYANVTVRNKLSGRLIGWTLDERSSTWKAFKVYRCRAEPELDRFVGDSVSWYEGKDALDARRLVFPIHLLRMEARRGRAYSPAA